MDLDSFFISIIEGNFEGENGRGRSRQSYLDQIRELKAMNRERSLALTYMIFRILLS